MKSVENVDYYNKAYEKTEVPIGWLERDKERYNQPRDSVEGVCRQTNRRVVKTRTSRNCACCGTTISKGTTCMSRNTKKESRQWICEYCQYYIERYKNQMDRYFTLDCLSSAYPIKGEYPTNVWVWCQQRPHEFEDESLNTILDGIDMW